LRKNFLILVPALIAVFFTISSCGRKGDLIVPGTVLPKAVTDLSAQLKPGAVILSWTEPDKNNRNEPLTDLAGFMVLRAEIPKGETGCPCAFEKVGYVDLEFPKDAVVNGKKVVWADRRGIFGRRYAYKVVPVNKDEFSGEATETRPLNFLMPPGTIAEVTATAGNGTVQLSWEPVTEDQGGRKMDDLAGYNIYRHEKDVKGQTRINRQPVKENNYTDTGLINRTTYCYSITGLRGTEPPLTEGEQSAEVCATPAKLQPPPPPAGLQAVPGEGAVMLSWEPSTETDIAGYNLYRQEGANTPKKLNAALIPNTTYTDRDVATGVKYIYYVTAVDNAVPPNESVTSNTAEATLQP
jgi:predicted small lipoprotein YifL